MKYEYIKIILQTAILATIVIKIPVLSVIIIPFYFITLQGSVFNAHFNRVLAKRKLHSFNYKTKPTVSNVVYVDFSKE